MLSPQWLDELRSRLTLSSVIGRTTRLQKAGHEFKACCPFHNEKSPSFTVNDEKGFYHCFGCGAHGDAIRWMTDQRGLAFMDAVKELAAEAGMELPAPDPHAARQAEQRDSLHDVTKAAQAWFVEQLAGPEGAKARAYLATRGFDAHTVQRFGFGYAPEGRQALKGALGQFGEDRLIEAGLRIAVEEREPYDRFRGRLMLPIEDARGRVIAFGGRILDKDKKDAPKYLNSPDTPLFDKGRTLYNLHRAGPAARQSGRMIVVEGYMDVIALAAAGFPEAVAPLGTALTEHQLALLWRVVETPILCFDGDAAGQRAAMRAISRALPLLKPAHSLRIVRLPAWLDPDDLIRQQGAPAMESLLAAAKPLIETLWEHERDALPLATPEDKAGLKARLLTHVDAIVDPDIKALYRRDLLERFSDHAFPRRERDQASPPGFQRGTRSVGGWRPNTPPPPAPATVRFARRDAGSQRDALAAAVLLGLVRHPALLARHAEGLLRVRFGADWLGHLLELMLDLAEAGPLESQGLATTLAERGARLPTFIECGNLPYPFLVEGAEPDRALACLEAALALLTEGPVVDAAIRAATEAVELDFDEQQRLRARKAELETRLKDLMRP